MMMRTRRFRECLYLFLLLCFRIANAQFGGMFTPKEIRELGLQPLFSDNETQSIILTAAELSLKVYQRDRSETELEWMVAKSKWTAGLAVVFYRGSDYCHAAFRGPQHGLRWIGRISTLISHIRVKGDEQKSCRTLRGYKRLYLQDRGVENPFREQLELKLDECHAAGLQLVFSGHSLGGAIAAMAAVRYAFAEPYLITFGQPPVFQPAWYKQPWTRQHRKHNSMDRRSLQRMPGRGGTRRMKRQKPNPGSAGCPYIRRDRYFRFMNTEMVERTTVIEGPPYVVVDAAQPYQKLAYDPVVYLQTLLYGVLQAPDLFEAAACVKKGVERLQEHFGSNWKRGNLGDHIRGYVYQLPPTDIDLEIESLFDVGWAYHPKGKFAPANGRDERVTLDHLDAASIGTDCLAIPMIHSMETYHSKLNQLHQDEVMEIPDAGFADFMPCNFNSECQHEKECSDPGFERANERVCFRPGARPRFEFLPTLSPTTRSIYPSVTPHPTLPPTLFNTLGLLDTEFPSQTPRKGT